MAGPGKPAPDDEKSPGPRRGGAGPDEYPALPPGPLPVSAVARRLGVAPATLRTWDRRYGVGPRDHRPGAQRRYTAADVERLDRMRRLMVAGLSPADAAHAVTGAADPPGTEPAGAADDDAQAAAAARRGERGVAGAASRGGGGRVVALRGQPSGARGLARAAMDLDSVSLSRALRAAVRDRGVVGTWDQLLVPVLSGIGERWEATGEGVDAEHLLSECVIGAMHAVTASMRGSGRRPVLLACAAEEGHALPLHALAAALAERGVPARLLGARVPTDALAAAYRRLGPPALFVWSSGAATGDSRQLTALPALRPRPRLLVGGPGWPDELPRLVQRAVTLSDAVGLLADAAT